METNTLTDAKKQLKKDRPPRPDAEALMDARTYQGPPNKFLSRYPRPFEGI